MACRQIWEDVYALEIFKTGTTLTQVTTGNPVFATGTHGVKGGFGTGAGNLTPKYNVLVDGSYPALKASYASVEKNLATGKSMQVASSITPVSSKPEPVVIPMIFNAHNLSAIFRLFAQDGMSLATGTANTALQIMTCIPFQDACPVVYGNLARFRQDASGVDTVDQVLKGVIPTRILIRGEEGGIIEGEVEFLGAKWENLDLSDKLAAAAGYDETPPLKFEDLTVKLGTTTISIPNFEITFQNGLVHHFYNETASKSVTLGRFNCEAQLTVPWNDSSTEGTDKQIEDFAAGTYKTLSLIWGNPASTTTIGSTTATLYGGVDTVQGNAKNSILNNYFAIHALMKIMDYDESDLDESPMITPNFKAILDSSNTLNGVTVYIGYLATANNWTETS